MKTIQIFKDERDAGLEEKLRSTAALSFYTPVKLVTGPPDEKVLEKLRMSTTARDWAKATNLNQDDLHYLNTILVTAGVWNKNDDVFDQIETYVARATPEDKPFNYEHDCSDIIGHITGCSVFDAEMNPVTGVEEDFSNLPSKFHIVTGGVLYKVWSKPELQERMDSVIAEIAKGEWHVSMECLFYGFDYALKSADGSQRVIARTEETAFLTKYLRAYGGSGEWKDGRIGRVLRNISFSGIGLVRKPANPESVVLDDPAIFDGRSVASELQEKISEKIIVPKNPVYSELAQGSEQKTSESEMKTVEQLTIELAAANTEIESLKSASATSVTTIETLSKTIDTNKTAIAGLETTLTSVNEAKTKVEGERDGLKASLEAANTELGTMKAAAKKVERLGIVASKLKIQGETATKLVDGTASLADEAFATQVELMAGAIAAATPAPAAAAATPAPTPKPEDAAPEVDAAEAAADAKVLEGVKTPSKASAASVPVEEADEVGEVRAAIASYLKPEKSKK